MITINRMFNQKQKDIICDLIQISDSSRFDQIIFSCPSGKELEITIVKNQKKTIRTIPITEYDNEITND